MTPADSNRLERILKLTDRLLDALADAERRGIIREWKGANSRVSLRDDLAEFHQWHARTLATAKTAGEAA